MTAVEVGQRLGARDCESFVDGAVCPGDDGRLRVSVSPRIGSLPGGSVAFTVRY